MAADGAVLFVGYVDVAVDGGLLSDFGDASGAGDDFEGFFDGCWFGFGVVEVEGCLREGSDGEEGA